MKIISIIKIVFVVCLSAVFFSYTCIEPAVDASKEGLTERYVSDNWNTLIANEMNKYPETSCGQQCYFNGGNSETFTTTPCDHSKNSSDYCNRISTDDYIIYRSNDFSNIFGTSSSQSGTASSSGGSGNCYLQCQGFAHKLASDIYNTKTFVQYKFDNELNITDITGNKTKYVPQKGDILRTLVNPATLHHSIFITDIDSHGNITFAQCNAHGTCEIDWDETCIFFDNRDLPDLTVDSLDTILVGSDNDTHGSYVDRPVRKGDLNLDGKVDRKDSDILQNFLTTSLQTVNGHTFPLNAADVNDDCIVDKKDYYRIRSITDETSKELKYLSHEQCVAPPLSDPAW
ncbi:MAG: hypothetical protein Q4F95_09965 [Oscillospiraceae bacterium]|nr:hypothetical protein [Oscillospiraceae bacterium]